MAKVPAAFQQYSKAGQNAASAAMKQATKDYAGEQTMVHAAGHHAAQQADARSGRNFIQGAIKHPGALHAELGVPKDKKIPKAKIEKAAKSKNPTLARRARFAETLEKMGK